MATTLRKQPWEELTFGMDFSGVLGSGRSISSVVSVEALASSPGGLSDLSISSATVDGDNRIAFIVTGGTDGEAYPIRARVEDDNSNKIEGDGVLLVNDIT